METVFNWITDKLDYILSTILVMLPDSPFADVIYDNPAVAEVLGYLNYFLPISEILVILTAWLTAISIFYVYQLILRWAKAIE